MLSNHLHRKSGNLIVAEHSSSALATTEKVEKTTNNKKHNEMEMVGIGALVWMVKTEEINPGSG